MTRGVVFIHGMWSRPSVWGRWLSPFAERGYVCSAVTLPGHHADAGDQALIGLSFDECVQAAAEVAARCVRPILVGHSMGGLIAQKLATKLNPRALVLINSAAPRAIFPLRGSNVRGLARHFVRWGLWRDVLRLSDAEADYLLFGSLPAPERARALQERCAESGRLAFQLGFGRLGSSQHAVQARDIRCPMLALAGVRDRMIPIAVSRAMARHYAGQIDYREYDAAHWLLEEPGYAERIREVLGWLGEHAETHEAHPEVRA